MHSATETLDLELGMDAPMGSPPAIVGNRQPQAPAQTESAGMIAMIERMAGDNSIDLERLKTLLDLRRSMKEEAARETFNAAMAHVKAELPQVVKNAENTDNHSRYATLDAIGEAADRVIASHGFSTSFYPAPCERDGFLRVECVVAHEGGHERKFSADIPIDATGLKGGVNKTATHAWKSTMTYGRRVLTEMIFDIKSKTLTRDDDGNAAGGKKPPELLSADQADIIRELVKKSESNLEAMLKMCRAESIPDILAADFEPLKKQLEGKLEAKLVKIGEQKFR